MCNKSNCWVDLPKEILELIGKRLETRIDVFRFRAICSSWRSVVPLSHHQCPLSPPLNLPPPLSAKACLFPVMLCRLENETRSATCLIKVTESTSGKMIIMNPLSSHDIIKSSPISTKSISILSLRVVEVCKGYRLEFKHRSPLDVKVKKVVLFGKCGIMVIYNTGTLGYLGFKDENWTFPGGEETEYHDIIIYNGQFYVVNSLGTVYWVDGKSMSLVQFSPPLFGLGQLKNLVVSDGGLFVVDSYYDMEEPQSRRPVVNFERVDMRVYKLDEEWGTWVDVKSLGDWVFVLGKEVCFSISTKDIPGCDGNCVYFLDLKLEDLYVSDFFKRYFARVFDIEDRRRMKTVDCFPSHRKLFSLPMNFPCTSSSLE